MAKENKEFLQLLQRFYDHGLLREVYTSDKAIVCNAFNQFYMAFSLELIEKYTDQYPGFSMNATGLKYIVEDDNFVNRYYIALSDKDQDEVLLIFNEELFQHFLKNKSESAQRPVAKGVDLAFEEELKIKGVDAMRPKKSGFFSFLRGR